MHYIIKHFNHLQVPYLYPATIPSINQSIYTDSLQNFSELPNEFDGAQTNIMIALSRRVESSDEEEAY